MRGGRRLVRFRDGFEMRCDECGEWLPLDRAEWAPLYGLARCSACQHAKWRAKANGRYRQDRAYRAGHCEARRIHYRLNRMDENARRRARYARQHEREAA